MINYFFCASKRKMAAALCAMTSAILLTTSCGVGEQNTDSLSVSTKKENINSTIAHSQTASLNAVKDIHDDKPIPIPIPEEEKEIIVVPVEGGPGKELLPIDQLPIFDDTEQFPLPPPPFPPWIDVPEPRGEFDVIELMVRTDPANPQNERFLGAWRLEISNIGDQSRPTGPSYFANSDPNGSIAVGLPSHMLGQPLHITAHNDLLALECNDTTGSAAASCPQHAFEIIVPSNCALNAVWLLGPVENAIWNYYKQASLRYADAWNLSQVDCATWLTNLQLVILTDEISDALDEQSDMEEALVSALRGNQNLLVPTRPPLCMAERRHNGGGMERGDIVNAPYKLNDKWVSENIVGIDEVTMGNNGIVNNLCGINLTGTLKINGNDFAPSKNYLLDDEDFLGTIHDHNGIAPKIDASVFNVKLGNGRELEHDKYDDACALTSVIEFTNTDDDEQDVLTDSGVTFSDLFGNGPNTEVYLTSDGDRVVDENDTWAIFHNDWGNGQEKVIAVELLGHRKEDFRDVLNMKFDVATDDLFLGLRADYELNEEEVDGERAFLSYTIHVWDGSTSEGRNALRRNISNCFEASDVWARQFFNRQALETTSVIIDKERVVESNITPLVAAEFAVRSQCFSNSRANQRWRTDDAGFWSMNTDHGVAGNVVVNPGWLAPDLDFEVYIQKFDEAVFKGPRTVKRSDASGQLMFELPTLIEGDRVLIKSEDNCCDDYDLVLPCVPEFTGFAGAPGIPFVPVIWPEIPMPVPPISPILVPMPKHHR